MKVRRYGNTVSIHNHLPFQLAKKCVKVGKDFYCPAFKRIAAAL